MSTKSKSAVQPTLFTAIDPNSGDTYRACGVTLEDGSRCLRYTGHGKKRGNHRASLYRPVDPTKADRIAAYKAMTPEQRKAEFARRAEAKAAAKAAPQPVLASSAPQVRKVTPKAAPKAARKAPARRKVMVKA